MSRKEPANSPKYYAKDSKAWRQWLQDHHNSERGVWLIIYHKDSTTQSITYDRAVDDALCFGWIDSKPNKRDRESYYQYFSRRNPKSNWSRVNKERVRRLTEQGLMEEPGQAMVRIAKQNGTWDALNDVENLIVPPDLQELFDKDPEALANWMQFPRSVKRGILEWIFNAKRPRTRHKRISETVSLAHENIRANQYHPNKKK